MNASWDNPDPLEIPAAHSHDWRTAPPNPSLSSYLRARAPLAVAAFALGWTLGVLAGLVV